MSRSALYDTFARAPVAFERGEGAWLFDTEGRKYLDFSGGIAVTTLGHAHPVLVRALTEQAQKLWHTSNLFHIPGQERLAERLAANSFADRVFFCNSGAEAIECLIKTTRRYHFAKGNPQRNRIITFTGAFHGRTIATLAATGNAKYLEGFGPALDGFDQVPLGDLEAVKAAIGPETAGILIEPLQGEGGVRLVEPSFMRSLRRLCDEHGLLLLLDEVQSGMGRTGKFFTYEWSAIEPDIVAVAKGLGGGFPIGACLATNEAASGMTPGTHGSTFGGNPLAMAVGNAILDVILADGFLDHVRQMGLILKQRLAGVVDDHPAVVDQVRGEGLLLGIRGVKPVATILQAMREQRLLAAGAGENVVRLLPPLIIGESEIEEAITRLDAALSTLDPVPAEAAAGGAQA
jgi:acetylornithine/N-succinyldiaminopimelate aminotransferase